MNPCPCGHYGDPQRSCRCSAQQIRQYQGKISGPLLDRIDIHVEVPAVGYGELAGRQEGEKSHVVRKRIEEARSRQRYRGHDGIRAVNASLTDREVKQWCPLDGEGEHLLRGAMERLGLSARAYMRILKVARTIADLEGEEKIGPSHVAEAIQYRSLDRRLTV